MFGEIGIFRSTAETVMRVLREHRMSAEVRKGSVVTFCFRVILVCFRKRGSARDYPSAFSLRFQSSPNFKLYFVECRRCSGPSSTTR